MFEQGPRSRFRTIGELLAGVAVVASLVFVGMELRQNTAAVRAQTRQGLAERNGDFITSISENPELARAFDLRWEPDGISRPGVLTHTDSVQARLAMAGLLRSVENVYLQFNEGVIDETVLESYAFRQNPVFGTPQFLEYWVAVRDRFDARFVAAFEMEYDLSER